MTNDKINNVGEIINNIKWIEISKFVAGKTLKTFYKNQQHIGSCEICMSKLVASN